MMENELLGIIKNKLKKIYNSIPWEEEQLIVLVKEILKLKTKTKTSEQKWSEENIILITYGDSIVKDNEKPLTTLNQFLHNF